MKRYLNMAVVAALALTVQVVGSAKAEAAVLAAGACPAGYVCTQVGGRTVMSRGHDGDFSRGFRSSRLRGFLNSGSAPLTVNASALASNAFLYASGINTFSSLDLLFSEAIAEGATGPQGLQFLALAHDAQLEVNSFTGNFGTITFDLARDATGLTSGKVHATGNVNLSGLVIDMTGVDAVAGESVQLFGCRITGAENVILENGWKGYLKKFDDHDEYWATAAPVPEPSTVMLLGLGLAGLVGTGIRRRAKQSRN